MSPTPRTEPHDLHAEQAVLGAALLAPVVIADLASRLAAADFHRPAHGTLWEALLDMHATGHPTDLVAVTAHLNDTGVLGRVGGAPYLHTLMQACPTPANAGHYAGIVAEHARRRAVAVLGTRLTQLAGSGTDTADVLAASRALLATTSTTTGGGHWPAPVPLGDRRHLPAFPVAVLPGWLADMIAAVAEFTQTPPDLPGSLALACLSTAAGGRAVVEVRGTWTEPVNLYIVVVLPPGSRKSAVFAAMTAPLLAAERTLVDQARPIIVEADLAARVAGKTAERAANAAANTTDPAARDRLLADAAAAAVHAETVTVPALPRLVADDITSEKAASLLAEQDGRLAVLSAEGGIFATLAGRYSGTPNLEVFLKGHAGDMLRVDRQGRGGEHVDHPALTLGLAVQPEVLRDIAGMPGFRGKGLLARILFAVPENTVGRRRIGPPAIPTDIAEAYTGDLTSLVLTLAEWTDPAVLPLTPEANQRVLAIETAVEPRLTAAGAWGHIVDWGAKYTGAVVRLAGLIHLATHLRDGWGRPIRATTVDAAAALGDYYAAHALAAFHDMGADPTTEHARTVLAWIERTHATAFTKRDLYRAFRSQIPKAADLDPILDLLDTHGWIRRLDSPERASAGRPPSPTYLAHPDLTRTAGTLHTLAEPPRRTA